MIRFIILLIVAYIAYRALQNWFFPKAPDDTRRMAKPPRGEIDDFMVQDPYCGTYFPSRDGFRYREGDRELTFCSEACKQKYIAAQQSKPSGE
jgi:hypothetical protein